MGDYATKRTNQMTPATMPAQPQVQQTWADYRTAPPSTGAISQAINPNRGDPNVRKAAKLVVEEPKKEAPKAPAPEQIAAQQQAAALKAQQQAAAIAAQQAAFWAQHAASQRMKAGG